MLKSLLFILPMIVSLDTVKLQKQAHNKQLKVLGGSIMNQNSIWGDKVTQRAYDSIMKKVGAYAKPSAVSGFSYSVLSTAKEGGSEKLKSRLEIFVSDGLAVEGIDVIVKFVKKPVVKKFAFFTMIGGAVLAGEEYIMPGVNRYLRWGIALLIATLGVIFYHFQNKPKERKNMF